MGVIWFCFVAGALFITFRRPYAKYVARVVKRPDDDERYVQAATLIGGVLVAGGVTFLGIWLFH